jgi:hypothetical protein
MSEPIPPLSALRVELPAAVVGVVERALARDRAARPNGGAELAELLERAF